MPAVDQCEPAVISAFEKAGWVVTARPYSLRIPGDRQKLRYVFADLRLEKESQVAIVVEVKCFPNPQGFLNDFYQAIGQYEAYRVILRLNQLNLPIYLAIPQVAYIKFFGQKTIQAILDTINAKLIIIDTEHEEIIQWNN
jgi:hypothetical protein